jgi:KTSC domain
MEGRTGGKTVSMATPEERKGRDKRAGASTNTGRDDWDEAESRQHDLGPWVETSSSSRVRAFRYDYANGNVQVTWRNSKGPGHVYEDVPFEVFRSFARITSKGKAVNSTLNGFNYRPISPEELGAPSNDARSTPSRTRL